MYRMGRNSQMCLAAIRCWKADCNSSRTFRLNEISNIARFSIPGRSVLLSRLSRSILSPDPFRAASTRAYDCHPWFSFIDLYGRPLRERFSKRFLVVDPVCEPIAVESWKSLTPMTGSRQALVLMFTKPPDWALVLLGAVIALQGPSIDLFERTPIWHENRTARR